MNWKQVIPWVLVAPLMLILFTQAAFAQAVPALLVPADARALSMGGTALQRDADKLDVKAFYGIWAPGSAGNTLAGGDGFFRVNGRVSLSAEGRAFLDKPYQGSSPQGQAAGTFRPVDWIAGAGVKVGIADAFAIGVKARVVSSAIAEDAKAFAFCGDVDFTYTGEIVTASVGARNLGSRINYGGDASYPLPALAALQGCVNPLDGFTVSAGVDYLFSGALMAGLGLEYSFADIVSLRGGFHYGDPAKAIPTYVSFGLGLQFAGVHFDAAFLTASKTLGNTLLFSLGYAF